MFNDNGGKGSNVNLNTPAQIKRRIAALKKQIAKEQRIKELLRQEQLLIDQIKGGW